MTLMDEMAQAFAYLKERRPPVGHSYEIAEWAAAHELLDAFNVPRAGGAKDPLPGAVLSLRGRILYLAAAMRDGADFMGQPNSGSVVPSERGAGDAVNGVGESATPQSTSPARTNRPPRCSYDPECFCGVPVSAECREALVERARRALAFEDGTVEPWADHHYRAEAEAVVTAVFSGPVS